MKALKIHPIVGFVFAKYQSFGKDDLSPSPFCFQGYNNRDKNHKQYLSRSSSKSLLLGLTKVAKFAIVKRHIRNKKTMSFPINQIREAYALQTRQTEITDPNSGEVTFKGSPEEIAGYYNGRAAADKAVELLKRSGVVTPELEGMYEHQDKEFRTALQDIAMSLDVVPEVVYNPGCDRHVTLATAFPKARSIFVDTDVDAVHDVSSGGFEAHVADMHTYKLPDGIKADIVLILNAGHMTEEELKKVTADGGLVIVNDWHGAASYMKGECPNFELQEGVSSEQNVHASGGDKNDTNTLYVFKHQREIGSPLSIELSLGGEVQSLSNLPVAEGLN